MEKYLKREELEPSILEFLHTQFTCVVATCSDNIPRASHVEFFPTGLTLYVFAERGKMIDNVQKNPHVSIAVYARDAGMENRIGLRITGIAEIGGSDSKIFEEGLEAYMARTGVTGSSMPGSMHVLKIRPLEIAYMNAALEGRGYHMWQTLFLE